MGRLKTLPSRLSAAAPKLKRQTDSEGHGRAVEHWRGWYSLARWRKLRLVIFARDLFTCQRRECGRIEGDTSLLVADHRIPHKGDPALFWDPTNLQTLCKPCHDRDKQREERRATWA